MVGKGARGVPIAAAARRKGWVAVPFSSEWALVSVRSLACVLLPVAAQNRMIGPHYSASGKALRSRRFVS